MTNVQVNQVRFNQLTVLSANSEQLQLTGVSSLLVTIIKSDGLSKQPLHFTSM